MTSRTGGSWGTFKHDRELEFGTQVKNHIPRRSILSMMTPSSNTPVRNLQHPPSMTSRMGGTWGTSKHARELKCGTQVKNCISRQSILSMMTLSSNTPVRNLQHPPSMTSRTGGSWGTSKHARELKFGTQVENHISGWSITSRMILSSKTSVRDFVILQVWLRGWGVLDALLKMLESWNLVHKSRITYQDDPYCIWWPHPPRLQSVTLSILQVWLRGQEVLEAHLNMLESWNLVQKSRI